jgi:hypothetical protein
VDFLRLLGELNVGNSFVLLVFEAVDLTLHVTQLSLVALDFLFGALCFGVKVVRPLHLLFEIRRRLGIAILTRQVLGVRLDLVHRLAITLKTSDDVLSPCLGSVLDLLLPFDFFLNGLELTDLPRFDGDQLADGSLDGLKPAFSFSDVLVVDASHDVRIGHHIGGLATQNAAKEIENPTKETTDGRKHVVLLIPL